MKRKVYTKQMNKLKIQNMIKTESGDSDDNEMKYDVRDDTGENTGVSNISLHLLGTAKSGAKGDSSRLVALPNVKVLIDSHSRATKQTKSLYVEDALGSDNESTNYNNNNLHVDISNSYKNLNEMEGKVKDSGHPPLYQPSFLSHDSLENRSVQPDGAQSDSSSEEMPKFIALRTRRAQKESQAVISLVTDRKPLDGSHSVEERASFADHGNFATQPVRTPSAHLELLNPVMLPCRKQEQVQDNGGNINSESYLYSEPMVAWSQDNNRYVDYGWRCQNMYPGDAINSMDNTNNNDSSILSNNGESEVGYDDIAFRYDSSYLSDSSSSKATVVSGRRRRKRVQTPGQRSAANMRERRRMCHLNVAFDRLKEHLPSVKDKKKLSRIQTLKAAIYYIHLLRDSLKLC